MKVNWYLVLFLSGVFLCAVSILTSGIKRIPQYEIYETTNGTFLLHKRHGQIWKYGTISQKNGEVWDQGWFESPTYSQYEKDASFALLKEHEAKKKSK